MTVALWLQRFANDRPTLHGWLVLAWLIAMPLLAGSVVFLPRSTPHSKLLPQRAWLPFAMFALWLVVTGFHLFGVGYVHVFPWRNALLAPTVLAVAWAVLLRTLSPDLNLNVTWRRVLLCGPVAAPFLALADTPIFFALHAFNALAYGLLAWKLRPARSALILAALSLVLATAGLSDSCLSLLGLARGEWALGTVALAGLVPILCSRDPRLGFLGAVGCAALAGLVVLRLDCSWHWAAQAGLVFVLVHSLRWPDKQFPGARHARYYLGPLWVFTSFHWIRSADPQSLAGCLIAGAIVLVCCLVCWLVGRHRPPLCVPVYAGCVTAMSPGLDLAEAVWKIPPGYLAVLGSLPLFVLGTILALLRPRWSKGDSPP
jgi:hypothetical protein